MHCIMCCLSVIYDRMLQHFRLNLPQSRYWTAIIFLLLLQSWRGDSRGHNTQSLYCACFIDYVLFILARLVVLAMSVQKNGPVRLPAACQVFEICLLQDLGSAASRWNAGQLARSEANLSRTSPRPCGKTGKNSNSTTSIIQIAIFSFMLVTISSPTCVPSHSIMIIIIIKGGTKENIFIQRRLFVYDRL